jgi:Tfp pilus assembly protein PilF
LAFVLVFSGCSPETKTRREPTPAAQKYIEDARNELESNHLTEARALLELAREEGAPPEQTRSLAASIERETATALIEKDKLEQGHIGQAFELFSKAAELEPDEDKRLEDLLAAIETGRQAGVMAKKLAPLASQAVALKTRSEDAQRLAAQLWDDAGEPKRALPYYAWLHKVSPDETAITLRLAQLYLADDQLREAKRLFEDVHKAQPANVIAALKLAELHTRLNEHSKARALYEDLIEAYPERASILIRYARYLHEQGDTQRARQFQERAQQAQPGIERREMRQLR